MGAKIVWSPDAADDLESIKDYVAHHSETIAIGLVERILAAIDRLADFPMSGPRIRELPKLGLRHVVVPPYRVLYRVTENRTGVIVLVIAHGARDLKKLLKSRYPDPQ